MNKGTNVWALIVTLVIAGSIFSGIAGAANTSESLIDDATDVAGEVTSIDNSIASTSDVSLGEAVDNIELSWATGGDANWFGQTSTYYHDGDAAQSGDISHNQNSWIQTTVLGPATLSFYWKVSSEANYDWLEFYIDDIRRDRISGDVDWRQMSYDIDSGYHTLKWVYVKDGSVDRDSDCGWVDKVEFGSSTDQAEILEFEHTTSNVIPGSMGCASVTIQNTGTTTRSYWIGLSYRKQGAEWININPRQSDVMVPDGSANVQFSWTLTDEPGTYDIFTKIWNGYSTATDQMIPPSYDEQIDTGAFTIAASERDVKFQGLVTQVFYCYCPWPNFELNILIDNIIDDPNNVLESVDAILVPCLCSSPSNVESVDEGDRVEVYGTHDMALPISGDPWHVVNLLETQHYLRILDTENPIAHVDISHTYQGDLHVWVGVGDPDSPIIEQSLWDGSGGSADNLDLDIELIGFTDYWPPSDEQGWYLKVYDGAVGDQGRVDSFSVEYQGNTYTSDDRPTINDLGTCYAWIGGSSEGENLLRETIEPVGYGHALKFQLFGPDTVTSNEIISYKVRIESIRTDGGTEGNILLKGNVYTCYSDSYVETYPVSIKERWGGTWYEIDPLQDWESGPINDAIAGEVVSIAIPIPGLSILLALLHDNPPEPSEGSVFYDNNNYDTIQIPFTPPTKIGSRYVGVHSNAVEIEIPYNFTTSETIPIYFFMYGDIDTVLPTDPVCTPAFNILVDVT